MDRRLSRISDIPILYKRAKIFDGPSLMLSWALILGLYSLSLLRFFGRDWRITHHIIFRIYF